MKIYKEKQFLVFDFEDGKTVKYDFATKKSIGKSGKYVKGLNSQLRDLSIDQLCEYCVDKQYGKFLKYVQRREGNIYNIGTILNRVPYYSKYEQIYSAGIEDIVDTSNFSYTINDIPKALIRLCREHEIKLSNNFLTWYKENPDAHLLGYNLKYISLTDNDLYRIFTTYISRRKPETYCYEYMSYFNILLKEYGYTAKGLLNYLDYCKTFEAIDDINFLMKEIYDYASMMKKISPKFDKYPRHFLTTHKIACRNYNRLKEQFIEEDFRKRIDIEMEKTFGEYCFIYPKSTQDIKDEAVSQNNCVASYIKRVIDGQCHIMFLRKKECPEKSLVTIEVRNGKIVQALQKFNNPLTTEQQEVVDKWNKWYANKTKDTESVG
ncbi:MAG: PcfJ domain-containing protein [Paludibacteraceae bacterium]|nr:PcfJ domain-containing protein [Paludibacteraceae bacterium]